MKKINNQSGFSSITLGIIILILMGLGIRYYFWSKTYVGDMVEVDKNAPVNDEATIKEAMDRINAGAAAGNGFSDVSVKVAVKEWELPCIPYTEIPQNRLDINLAGKTGFVVEKTEDFYHIQGKTPGQLFYQMTNCIPKLKSMPKDSQAVAIANTSFNRDFDYQEKGGKICDIKNATVGVRSTVVYPKWDQPVDADSALVKKWNTYSASVKSHEEKHVANAVTYTKKYYDYLSQLSKGKTCVNSMSVIDQKQNEILKEWQAADAEHDRTSPDGGFSI